MDKNGVNRKKPGAFDPPGQGRILVTHSGLYSGFLSVLVS